MDEFFEQVGGNQPALCPLWHLPFLTHELVQDSPAPKSCSALTPV